MSCLCICVVSRRVCVSSWPITLRQYYCSLINSGAACWPQGARVLNEQPPAPGAQAGECCMKPTECFHLAPPPPPLFALALCLCSQLQSLAKVLWGRRRHIATVLFLVAQQSNVWTPFSHKMKAWFLQVNAGYMLKMHAFLISGTFKKALRWQLGYKQSFISGSTDRDSNTPWDYRLIPTTYIQYVVSPFIACSSTKLKASSQRRLTLAAIPHASRWSWAQTILVHWCEWMGCIMAGDHSAIFFFLFLFLLQSLLWKDGGAYHEMIHVFPLQRVRHEEHSALLSVVEHYGPVFYVSLKYLFWIYSCRPARTGL